MTKPAWNRWRIRDALDKRGTNLTLTARKYGLWDSACREALSRGNTRGEIALSKELGVPLEELFPRKYGRHEDRRQPNAKPASESRQKRNRVADSTRAPA